MPGSRLAAWSAALFTAMLVSTPLTAAERGTAPRQQKETQGAGAGVWQQRRDLLAGVKSWGIQLRLMETVGIANAPFDLVVVDYAPYRHLSFEFPFSPGDVKKMQATAGGKRRLVLSYLSIGEAEDYRYYWNRDWRMAGQKPSWLGEENPQWPGNYPVRFWAPDWQQLIVDGPHSYLDRLIAAGFDGVFLDRADVYEEWAATNPQAAAQMSAFLIKLARHARAQRPDFLILLQNAEELLMRAEVRRVIDGFAKEDLLFGAQASGEANPDSMVSYSLNLLRLGRRSGLRIFVLEYLSEAKKAAAARTRLVKEGFLAHIAERSLSTLTLKGPDELEADAGAHGDAAGDAARQLQR